MDVALVIEKLVPNARYFGGVTSNNQQAYNNLVWRDDRPKPTWQELLNVSEDALEEYVEEKINEKRENQSDWNQNDDTKEDYIKNKPTISETKTLIIYDRKLSWQNSGTWTAWAWRTHDLNSIEYNNIGGANLTNNKIVLPQGLYEIDFYAMAYRVEKFLYRIYNMTLNNNTPLIESLTGYSRNHNNGHNNITGYGCGIFNLDSESELELQGYCQNTFANDGFGLRRNLGDVGGYDPDNIYAQVKIKKIG